MAQAAEDNKVSSSDIRYKSIGRIVPRTFGAILLIPPEISEFYFTLIPLYFNKQKQAYKPHITLIRGFEKPLFNIDWVLFNDNEVEFTYAPIINYDGTYWYLNAWSDYIGYIRELAGLPIYREGYNSYHITIGNSKEKNE